MGLDMYAHSMPKDESRPPVDFDVEGLHGDATPRIHCWRKHPNLHGWMAGRYYEKGGTDDDFNVNTVELTRDDIDALERTILENGLPDTSGFFFGATTGEERDDDLEFIRKAREEFAKGRTIAYYAWW
jgi:hypothetical protein